MVQRYGNFLNNQTILSLISKYNWLFLLITEIFSYICTCNPQGKSGSDPSPDPNKITYG